VAFPYLALPNQYVQHIHQWKTRQDYPFAFVGSVSHRLRKRVIALQSHSDGVVDTSEFNVWDATLEERASQGMRFAEAMARSKFVLCPRGIGTSSYRQFEAMQAARAPVIISDKWVAPPQVDWSFAITVREADIENIPDILANYATEAADRGRAARAAWESAYAPDVLFDTTVQAIADLQKQRMQRPVSGTSMSQLMPEFAPVKDWLTEMEVAARMTAQTYRQA